LPVRSQTLTLDAAKSDPFVADAPHAAAAAEPGAVAPNAAPTGAQPAPPVTAPERVAAAAPAKPITESTSAQRVAVAAIPKPAEAHAAPSRTEARGDWAVQLGVFSAEDNARRLAQKVNVYGYKPEVASYKSNGRAMYRVRLGPYASRAEADATASALSAHSFAAQVVAAD
jgi:cell division septation protein DedD